MKRFYSDMSRLVADTQQVKKSALKKGFAQGVVLLGLIGWAVSDKVAESSTLKALFV